MGTQTYAVQVERTEHGFHVRSNVRNFVLELGAYRGDPDAGYRDPPYGDSAFGGMAAMCRMSRLR
jgi:hypothetical protein